MERRDAYLTDTQHIVNLSGYVWAAKQLPGIGHMTILDQACGEGYGSAYLGGLALKVVGVDVAVDVIARCRLRYANTRVSFIAMDGCALGFRGETFDCVVSQDTIEHVVEDRLFVAEIARVLRKTGVLILFTPHGKGHGVKPDDPFHVREYAPAELRDLLAPHFTAIRWFGRRQGERLKTVEKHMDAVRRWDPGGLRRIVPRRVRHWLGSLVSRAHGGVALNEVTPEDIEYREEYGDDTNLIAICMK